MDAIIQSLNAQVLAAFGPQMGPAAWLFAKSLTMILMVMVPVLIFVLYFQLVERWVIGWIQVRRGPNRVGWFGLLQPIADALKLLMKEQIVPTGANRFLFLIGLVGSGGLAFGFVFWYRSLQRMRVEHAQMFLLDTAWRETRSELSRQEKWRAWGQGTFHAVSGRNPEQGPGTLVVMAVFIALFLLSLLFGSILIYAIF